MTTQKLCSKYLHDFWDQKISLQELEEKCQQLIAEQVEFSFKTKTLENLSGKKEVKNYEKNDFRRA